MNKLSFKQRERRTKGQTVKGLSLSSLSLFFFLFLISFTSAQTYNQESIIDLKISTNLTNCNLTVAYPDSSNLVFEVPMSINKGYANYTLAPLTEIGIYQYFSECGSGTFEVTSGTNDGSITLFIFLYILFYGITILGLIKKHEWITLGGCFGLLIIGIYTGINGFDIYKNELTNIISYITLLIGLGLGFETLIEITNY